MKGQHENGEMLSGGNASDVYRSGDTVRRDLKPDSVIVHKLFEYCGQIEPAVRSFEPPFAED